MDVKGAIQMAVDKEQAAFDLYSGLAGMTDVPATRSLLEELAEEERSHRKLLSELDPARIAEFEPEDREDMQITEFLKDVAAPPRGNFQETLIYAMEREQEARDFYGRMAGRAGAPRLHELFEKLATMENTHKARLEELYEDIFMRES